MTVFLCGETVDDIFCGIYDAWMSRLGHEHVRLELPGGDRELFSRYRQVDLDAGKAGKVADSIRQKLGETVYETVYQALLSWEPGRADGAYRFLVHAFAVGPRILDMLQIPAVYEIFRLTRNVSRERHQYVEFTHFAQMEGGILIGKIRPKNDVVTLVAPHFADRMPEENWILYDCGRKKAVVCQAGRGWVVVSADSRQWQHRLEQATDEAAFAGLWKTFHNAIAIEARANYLCQRNMLPLRFRPLMVEFNRYCLSEE